MPRRQFIADLQKAQDGMLPLGITTLGHGEDDGQIQFEFSGPPDAPLPEPLTITAMIPELGDYPKSHEYMIFCDDDAPKQIGSALQKVRGTDRKTVYELLDIVSASLLKLSSDQDRDFDMPDSQLNDEEYDGSDADDEDIYDSDHEAFGIGSPQYTTPYSKAPATITLKPSDRVFRARVRSDLRTPKDAGFKVGHLGALMAGYNTFVTISIRISKLGISEEAMQAWQINPADYLILIIQYPNGYKANEELQAVESHRVAANLAMRVCVGKRYKPTLQEAIKAFSIVKKNERASKGSSALPGPDDEGGEQSLRETFISKPLQNLLQERLLQILRYRGMGMDWHGAEDWYIEAASKGASGADAIPDKYFEPEPIHAALPSIVTADHGAQRNIFQHSFPLLAMQFMLRHFVRCTDFCLVCHRRLSDDLEAIKPYVCDSSLCLYQYMTLGFGPSIEHEIVAQPYVVDLLVSFCYSSAYTMKLKDLPEGLALMVPPVQLTPGAVNADPYLLGYSGAPTPPQHDVPPLPVYNVGLDRGTREIIFFKKPEACPVRAGSWIVIKETGSISQEELHCRVSEVTYYPTVRLDNPVIIKSSTDYPSSSAPVSNKDREPISPAQTPKWATATFQVYDQDFDQLDHRGRCVSIRKLLQTLPNVTRMRDYLSKTTSVDLKHWVERISPAALSLLRWIIASNRSCIMQVDSKSQSGIAPQERCYGMKDMMQFRFAMGAPDKEQRFIDEVRNTTERLNLSYPTIFAFHGSPLHNWHMIIREGLHYKNADHGRAYGHGVYHAKDSTTSSGYSMRYGGNSTSSGNQSIPPGSWPSSELNITSALALNEIVNAPAEFTSHNPFYVVQHLDWIQTRYLFVQCRPKNDDLKPAADTKPTNVHPQDPTRTPRGVSDHIIIPASAITSGRAIEGGARGSKQSKKDMSPQKKLKGHGGFMDPIMVDGDSDDDDSTSQATDAEDIEILFEDEPEPGAVRNDSAAGALIKKPASANTDFVPGTLDFTTLPLMPTPNYAISSTTKSLMKELSKLSKIQECAPLADLGWYIDTAKIENVYQWIVELHSFHIIDPTLRLVSDMQKAKTTSIVLEICFNKDFPFTPPYVRVVRPRMLPLSQGGGGHIVIGGALCMELLTNSGWSSVSSMESVLMQIRLAMTEDPPARVDVRGRGDYGTGEAAEGYVRACQTHGWVVPPGFREMTQGGPTGQKNVGGVEF